MTLESTIDQEQFHQRMKELWSQKGQQDLLDKLRTDAWERYLKIGLPTKETEVFRYIPLRKFFAETYSFAAPNHDAPPISTYEECSDTTIVFVNGFYRPDLSKIKGLGSIIALPLAEAMKTYSTFLHNQWKQELGSEKNPFTALNAAFHPAGLFLYVPPKTLQKKPIEILHIIDTDDNSLVQPRLHLFMGKQAEATIVRTQRIVRGSRLAINGTVSIALDEAAHLHYDHTLLEEPADTWHFESLKATLKRDSRLKTVEATDGAETIRHDYHVQLNGENCEVQLNGVWMLAEKRQAHANIVIEHVAPHCRSYQMFKSALTDSARSSFEGKIYVHPDAQKTEAYQLNNNLLLSDSAMADSKPNLEIFADDVKASHGSTVGQLEPEELFYLRTRGLSDQDARNILIYGFCKEVIDMIEIPSLKAEVTDRAQRYLKQG